MTKCAPHSMAAVLAAIIAASCVAHARAADARPAAEPSQGVWVVLPSAVGSTPEWRYTTDVPAETWIRPDFDDSAWKTGPGGFGTAATPNAHVRTEWKTQDIWLRRSFELDAPSAQLSAHDGGQDARLPGELFLAIHHDEDADVYLNGVKAASAPGFNAEHQLVPITPDALKTLKAGRNIIAVHCHQTSGGQCIDVGIIRSTLGRWSQERTHDWYAKQPWPCGFNYVPANAISYTEMFMDYNFDPALIDRELALSQEVGFNCMRVVLPFVVWEHDPAAFKKRLDAFLDICKKHGIRLMPALFDDCMFGPISDPVYGRQPEVVPGWYANGWTPSPGHSLTRDVAQWSRLKPYVQDIVGSFRDDPRVFVWDLYNEPTNGGFGDITTALVDRVFDWAREIDPSQPLTVGLFGDDARLNRLCLLRSDILTFHNYGRPDVLAAQIAELQAFGRPVICTEWLNRPLGSTVAGCLPVFDRARAGCMHWGLVNGKTQTHLGWGWRPGKGEPKEWQHDLYHGDHRPYDVKELELFKASIHALQAAGRADEQAPRSQP